MEKLYIARTLYKAQFVLSIQYTWSNVFYSVQPYHVQKGTIDCLGSISFDADPDPVL